MKPMLKAMIVSLLLLLIVLFAAPQADIMLTISSSFMVFLWIFSIFMIGIPSWHQSVSELCKKMTPPIVIGMIVMFPYILILIVSGFDLSSLPIFLIWYFLPAIIFFSPSFFKNQIPEEKKNIFRIIVNSIGAILLWIGFDHRYTKVIFDSYTDMGYIMNAFWVASVVMTSYGRQFSGIRIKENTNDLGLKPTINGIKLANYITPAASIIIIPFGLITGFLLWNPQEFDITNIIISFIGIYMTISLQEELIFRGVLLKELSNFDKIKSSKYFDIVVLVIVSIAFALTHWNNETPQYVYHYFFSAFIAGLAYGIAYKKGGMFTAMLSHTLVDWVWALLLNRV